MSTLQQRLGEFESAIKSAQTAMRRAVCIYDQIMHDINRSDTSTAERIAALVCGVRPADISGSRRTNPICLARYLFWWWKKNRAGMKSGKIAALTGHTGSTVRYGLRELDTMLKLEDRATKSKFNEFIKLMEEHEAHNHQA